MKRCDNILDPSISQNTWMYSFQFKTKLQRLSRFQLVSIHLVNHLHPFVLGISPQKARQLYEIPQTNGQVAQLCAHHGRARSKVIRELRWREFSSRQKIFPVSQLCVPPPFSLWIHWGGLERFPEWTEWVSHKEWCRFGGEFSPKIFGGEKPQRDCLNFAIHSQELP